ncbi:hypothetical protein AB4156_45160, partial [Cupriavidus sp. 2MCAB6]|uniref:hypothetical protein n=1 Tax=Cupriavidus sp. 2MCAB6 TaxID=3232981 RepID=UPI003F917F24
VMACSCNKYYPYLLSTEFDGVTWLYRWLLHPITSGSGSAEIVKFYIFDTPPNPSFKNLGLEIFNAAGQRVFHDEVRPLKVVSVQTCDASFTGVPGRSYVPLLLRAALYAQNIAPLPLGRY